MKKSVVVIVLSVLATSLAAPTVPSQTVFPTGTTIYERGAYDGYTLFIGGDGVVYLIDMDGTVANYWTSPDQGELLSEVEALPGGHILVNSAPAGQPKETALELDFYGNEVFRWEVPAGFKLHHDSERLANGNTMYMASQSITVPSISSKALTDDCLFEVDPKGNIVWSWFTWEHFGQFGWSADTVAQIASRGGDWAHSNSLDEIPPNDDTSPAMTPGNILVSQRQTNTMYVIDRTTGDIVWVLGGENHLTFGQHDPHMIRQGLVGAGHILAFDNGAGTGQPLKDTPAPGYSRVLEIDPDTKTIAWAYTAAKSGQSNFQFWSVVVSGAQRMPNGNTVICSGALGRLFEIDPSYHIVWEYISPFSGQQAGAERRLVFRAYRQPYGWAPHLLFKKQIKK